MKGPELLQASKHGRWVAELAGSGLIMVLLVIPAAAQDGRVLPAGPLAPPPVLAPQSIAPEVDPETAPVPQMPIAPRAPQPATVDPAVQVGQLEEVDPSVAGLLDETNGGLGLQMWAGSNRGRIEELLPRLPMGTLSPTVQRLARRLLLSSAAVPEGESIAPSLLGLRVERLMAGGQIERVNELLELAAVALDDPALSRAQVDAMLLAGDNAGACSRVSGLVRSDPQPYWTKALAFCRALESDGGAVSLAVALLRDQGEIEDEAFFSLVAALIGGETQLASLINPQPLHIAMLRAARQAVPADAVAGARPAVLWAIATMPNDELAVRVDAAERAEAAGALTAQVLADIYAAVPYTGDDIAVALQRASEEPGAMSNALLYQAAVIWDGGLMRATALQRAWVQARKSGAGFGTAARVSLPILRQIAPHPDLIWFAHDAGRALIAATEFDVAWAWLEMATAQGAIGNLHAAEVAARMWPLLQMADPEGAFMRDSRRARDWWTQLPEATDVEEFQQRALLYTLFEALGDEMPEAAWDPLFAAPLTVTSYQPSPALTHALRNASHDGRLAETVLLALMALGESGPEGADTAALFEVISGLRRVGLSAEARNIALEAAVGWGL